MERLLGVTLKASILRETMLLGMMLMDEMLLEVMSLG